MKIRTLLLLLILFLGRSVFAADATPLTVAVFDFDAHDPGVSDLGPKVATLLNATLSAEQNLITVERAELAKVLGEQELSLSGTVSPETAAKIGNITGAKILITGRIFMVDKDTVLVAKIISSETSRVYGEMVKGRGSPVDLSSDLARKISTTITTKGETLIAKPQTREERISKIKDQLKDARRPTVFVKIAERHFGAPANDPAAETELSNLLQSTGFAVVDSESKADVVISGEAFSAAATRKGNLHICKARVEVKAVARSQGEYPVKSMRLLVNGRPYLGLKGVQHQVQADQLRVTGKKRDDLQKTIASLREHDFGIPLQFTNFRD
jgi:hypothetical protein